MFEEMTFSAFESRYSDKSYIGSGGFAKVYKVFDHAKNHYVALKVADVRPEWKKFTLQNEVELVNSLPRHRNIARYDACYRYNTGLTGEMDFAILRFYEYGNLEQFVTKQELTKDDKKLIIRGILDGISFLHRHNVIHRDLKSQNILLHREDGVWTPKIIDFGLSRHIQGDSTITNSAIGLSYAYAAPEQIQNKKIYKNVDLWAIGVIIYRVIAGELPFQGRDGGDERSTQSQLELSRKIVELNLPEKLDTLAEPYQTMVRRCLVSDPAERIQTARELINILNGEMVETKTASITPGTVEEVNPPEEEKTQVVSNAFVPDEPVIEETPPSEKTQIILEPQVPATDKTTIVETPNANGQGDLPNAKIREEITPVVPPIEPPSYSAITRSDYVNIPSNPTQIIDKSVAVKEAPLVDNYQPKMGGDEKSRKWVWFVVPVLILGLLVGGFFAFQHLFANSSGKTKEPTGVISGTPVAPSFYGLMKANDNARYNSEVLQKLYGDISGKIKAYPRSYEPSYIMVKNRIYSNKVKDAFIHLKKSVKIAVRNKDTKALKERIEKDEKGVFKKVSQKYKDTWNKIIKPLETQSQ